MKYWRPKLLANVQRDRKNRRRLRRLGWQPIVIWECQTQRAEKLREQLTRKVNYKIDSANVTQ
jgi:DNA mismatch endonuclease (patch repair protein)